MALSSITQSVGSGLNQLTLFSFNHRYIVASINLGLVAYGAGSGDANTYLGMIGDAMGTFLRVTAVRVGLFVIGIILDPTILDKILPPSIITPPIITLPGVSPPIELAAPFGKVFRI